MSMAGMELNIRLILKARQEQPEEQAEIEKALGGLDLSKYPRPLANLTDAQLRRILWRSWRKGWA
jgi:hypothetical protein